MKQQEINITSLGDFAKINLESVDNSINNIITNQYTVFDKLTEAAKNLPEQNNKEVLQAIEELKEAVYKKDKKHIGNKFAKFVELSANFGTVFLQHIPKINEIVSNILS